MLKEKSIGIKYKSLNLLAIPEVVITSFNSVHPRTVKNKIINCSDICLHFFWITKVILALNAMLIPILPIAMIKILDIGNVISIF